MMPFDCARSKSAVDVKNTDKPYPTEKEYTGLRYARVTGIVAIVVKAGNANQDALERTEMTDAVAFLEEMKFILLVRVLLLLFLALFTFALPILFSAVNSSLLRCVAMIDDGRRYCCWRWR